MFFIHNLDYFIIIYRSSNLNRDFDCFILIYCWLMMLNSKYNIFDMFAHLIKFLFVLNFIQTELFSFTFPFFYNQLLSNFFVLRTGIEFFDWGDWQTAIVFETTYFLFLFNAAILIVNKRVIYVIKVGFWIPFLTFFDNFAWTIHIALFHYFFIKIISYWIKSWSINFWSLVIVQRL